MPDTYDIHASEQVSLQVVVPASLRADLKVAAAKQRTTIREYVVAALTASLEDDESGKDE